MTINLSLFALLMFFIICFPSCNPVKNPPIPPNIKSKIVNIQLIVPLPLHELARIVRKSAIFLTPKIAKSL